MAPGDWVRTCYPGIWQIYRILRIGQEMRFSFTERRRQSRRVVVFARRFVNAKWHRAFKTACCEQSLVAPLSGDDLYRLNQLLHDAEGLRASFERYKPKPIPLIVNLTMGILDRASLEKFSSDLLSPAMITGISMERVLTLLEAADLTQFLQKYPIRATLQMVCRDHEIRDGEFVFRDCRVLSS